MYILENREPVPVDNIVVWAEWMSRQDKRTIGQNVIGGVLVSTVFLGIDHQFGDGPPILFETMIFDGIHDGYQERYCTWDDALAGHALAVKLMRGEERIKKEGDD